MQRKQKSFLFWVFPHSIDEVRLEACLRGIDVNCLLKLNSLCFCIKNKSLKSPHPSSKTSHNSDFFICSKKTITTTKLVFFVSFLSFRRACVCALLRKSQICDANSHVLRATSEGARETVWIWNNNEQKLVPEHSLPKIAEWFTSSLLIYLFCMFQESEFDTRPIACVRSYCVVLQATGRRCSSCGSASSTSRTQTPSFSI